MVVFVFFVVLSFFVFFIEEEYFSFSWFVAHMMVCLVHVSEFLWTLTNLILLSLFHMSCNLGVLNLGADKISMLKSMRAIFYLWRNSSVRESRTVPEWPFVCSPFLFLHGSHLRARVNWHWWRRTVSPKEWKENPRKPKICYHHSRDMEKSRGCVSNFPGYPYPGLVWRFSDHQFRDIEKSWDTFYAYIRNE